MKKSLSVIVSAYNEEGNINTAIKNVTWAVKDIIQDFEIIVVDDGSSDSTFAVINEAKRKYKNIKIIRHPKNLGLGFAFRNGIKKAAKNYITVFPGDSDLSAKSFRNLISTIGEYDLVTTFMPKDTRKSKLRRIFSGAYVILMNYLFRLNLKYYNGPFVVRTNLIKNLPLKSQGYTIIAELTVRLIKKGVSWKATSFNHVDRRFQKSKAVTLKNFWRTLKAMVILFKDTYLQK